MVSAIPSYSLPRKDVAEILPVFLVPSSEGKVIAEDKPSDAGEAGGVGEPTAESAPGGFSL
jgi:hypothetical protein